MASALGSLLNRGAAGSLQFGEAYDDPTSQDVARYTQMFGGDYDAAAKAAWNTRERNRKRINQAGGESLLQIENQNRFGSMGRGNSSDPQLLQVATKLKNLAASKGKTQGGYAAAPRPEGTSQLQRMYERAGQDVQARRGKEQQYRASQAEGDAMRAAAQRQMLIEQQKADAAQEQRRQQQLQVDQANRAAAIASASGGPAMTALATRPFR